MNTPNKPNDDFAQSDISDFSHHCRLMESQTSKLMNRVRELEDQVRDLQAQLSERVLNIRGFEWG